MKELFIWEASDAGPQPDIRTDGTAEGLAWGSLDVAPGVPAWRVPMMMEAAPVFERDPRPHPVQVVMFERRRFWRGPGQGQAEVFAPAGLDVERAARCLARMCDPWLVEPADKELQSLIDRADTEDGEVW